MIQLPDDFIQQIRPIFGEERFERFVKALDEPSPVSIRVNPHKAPTNLPRLGEASEVSSEKQIIEHYQTSNPALYDIL